MADLRPFRALTYDPRVAGPLHRLVTPPYDVVDEAMRTRLAARSPYNVVHVDLPREPDGDPYVAAARSLAAWQEVGVLVRDKRPALWALEQHFVDGTGRPRVRRGVLGRVRLEPYGAGTIRPHERTHPEAIADRLALRRATQTNLSPVLLLAPADAHAALAVDLGARAPDAMVSDRAAASDLRAWRVTDSARIADAAEAIAGAELLVADGHHRYEAARAHAEELGGRGPHRFILACLVSDADAGLVIEPTPRLLTALTRPEQHEALARALREYFDVRAIERELRPSEDGGPIAFGYMDARDRRALRLTLKDPTLPARLLVDLPRTLRGLDVALLEALVLRGPAGLTADDVTHRRGLRYGRSDAEAAALVRDGTAQVGFWPRATDLATVRAVARAGAVMPPKSTSFSPKVPSGIVLDPLS